MTEQFWTIRACNGDNLANIRAETEEKALQIYWAMEELLELRGQRPELPDGRELVTKNRNVH